MLGPRGHSITKHNASFLAIIKIHVTLPPEEPVSSEQVGSLENTDDVELTLPQPYQSVHGYGNVPCSPFETGPVLRSRPDYCSQVSWPPSSHCSRNTWAELTSALPN